MSSRRSLAPLFAAALLAFPAAAPAGEATQTDWSGGPGLPGPIPAWESTFDTSEDVSWLSVPGQAALGSQITGSPISALVAGDMVNCETVEAADLDGDGDVDAATALPIRGGSGWILWHENAGDGISWTEHTVDNDFYGGKAVHLADVDGDGDVDILACAFYDELPEDRNGRYAWWENVNGDASVWEKHEIGDGYFWGAQDVGAADLDGDGDLDVYGAASLAYIGSLNDDVFWFENQDGAGTSWLQHRVDNGFDDAIGVEACDVDRDGDPDLVGVSYGVSQVVWWENTDGAGATWVRHFMVAFGDVGSLAVGDLDGDGDIDALTGSHNANFLLWCENVNDGASWVGHPFGTFFGNSMVRIADIDGNGTLDALAANDALTGGEVAWFANTDGSATAWARHSVDAAVNQGFDAYPADVDGNGSLEILYTFGDYSTSNPQGIISARIFTFTADGELNSSVLDTGEGRTWDSIDWTSSGGASTSLRFQVRSSNNPLALGPWSAEIGSPGSLAGILADDTRFVQYRALLATTDPHDSPVLEDVTLRWSETASVPPGELPLPTGLAFRAIEPNPSAGTSTVRFQLPADGLVTLSLYDTRGRSVATVARGTFAAGEREMQVEWPASGVYFARLEAGGKTDVRKLVIR